MIYNSVYFDFFQFKNFVDGFKLDNFRVPFNYITILKYDILNLIT